MAQMDEGTTGFIAQIKGTLATQHFRYATIFVDHFSRTSYIYPQISTSLKNTLRAKQAFEAFGRPNNVPRIHHYHCDNERFCDNAFIQEFIANGGTISFCGVSAHHQNGIAEKRIRDVTE